jgi:tetratricopeptide (TPR) repeat protein
MLLFDSGSSTAAQAEFRKVAQNLLETAKSYRKQALLKREEAINAYIFAGRVAAIDGDSVATIDAFNEAIDIKDGDYDARKFIGEQFREVGNLDDALREFKKLTGLAVTRRSKALTAEALRLQAGVLIAQKDVKTACEALEKSLGIATQQRDLAGLAATQDLLGDAHQRSGDIEASAQWYRLSVDNYRVLENKAQVKEVQYKLWRLQPEETFLSRAVTALGTFLIERVAKQLRAPAQMP